MVTATLAARIEELAATPAGVKLSQAALAAVDELLSALESGAVRAAERDTEGRWRAVPWVKRGILLGFRVGRVVDQSPHGAGPFRFFDKHTYPTRDLSLDDGVRVVPGGSTIRRGAYVGKGVVCMPPMFINVGAHVGAGTMVDSHALVGSCAQIGERVHLSAAAQIGGVLEPVNAAPVVVEDDAIVGGNCGVYEGTVVRSRAVLAAGVVLTRGTPVYDLVRERVYRAEGDRALEVPEGAVVVPGARDVNADWARGQGLSLQTPLIVKYRDERTDLSTTLESWLR
ncbi:MAG: 2,3,4,5-tetrahydropyridine-2,6-dicarboxylate N-succinyltransferase [Gemmatimonadetes bacterium GWC2_71_10]|nr:MAG: 2,3,4,5-tetrahydropyridine-2,6-dicarboxylate N-succinyltransferase [Gemmatimonadetes bacterium GWC2_71_10]